jgi:hypothetical protein
LVLLGTAACGGTTDSGGSVIMSSGGSGGAAGSGGSGFNPIGMGGGGTAATAGSGGSTSLAGSGGSSTLGGGGSGGSTSPAGGAGGRGPTGTPGYPSGAVILCFGMGCPKGECDDDMFFSDTPCATPYPTPVGPDSSYCNAGETDSYCMEAGAKYSPDYAVTCSNGSATVIKCFEGCGFQGTSPYMCN